MTEATTTAPAGTNPGEGGDPAAAEAAALAAAAAAKAPKEPVEPTQLEVTAEEDDKKGTFTYESTGDTKLDLSLTFLGKNGFGPGHPAMAAAVNGDFSILRAQLAEKGTPGAEAYIALAEAAYERMHGENEARRATDKAAIEKIAGGAEQWADIQKWAGTAASDEEKPAIQEMLGKGGQHAVIAATFLATMYERATGGVPEGEGAGKPVSESRGAPAVSTDALSPQEYGQAVAAARSAHKDRIPFEDSPAYQQLKARRLRFKG